MRAFIRKAFENAIQRTQKRARTHARTHIHLGLIGPQYEIPHGYMIGLERNKVCESEVRRGDRQTHLKGGRW